MARVIKTSAPGSTLVLGEHSVLSGEPAIICAVDKRIHVTLTPRCDMQVQIQSTLGNYTGHLDHPASDKTHRFTLCILNFFREKLSHGFNIEITSEFSHKVGLGSSAALTAALTAALHQFLYGTMDLPSIMETALLIINTVQGRGSGADLAASLYGGLISYSAAPAIQVTPLNTELPLTLFYSGYKTETSEVLKQVAADTQLSLGLHKKLYCLMGDCTREAIGAVTREDLTHLGRCMNYYHGLLDALGVCDKTLAEMNYTLRAQKAVLGSKISGSGLGDCLIALGKPDDNVLIQQRIPMETALTGVILEANTC